MNIIQKIADEQNIKTQQVQAAIALLDEGATVPFISRYRKEVTGGLDDTQLRNLAERLVYLRELEERKQTILKSIIEQNKLTPELEKNLLAVDNKTALEDLYLPYKQKRRTKALIAKEAGLEPLAMQILNELSDPEIAAKPYIDPAKNINTIAEALDGAKQILMELFAENAELIGTLRNYVWEQGILKSEIIKGKEIEGNKFTDYFDYTEALKKIPSHRALALFRGEREEILRLSLILSEDEENFCKHSIAKHFKVPMNHKWLLEVVSWTWRIKLFFKLDLDLMMQIRLQAEDEAIKVFANNLKHLLMAAPAGARATLGLDPGFRTGVKVVAVDTTGKLLAYTAIFPHEPRNDWDASLSILAKLCKQHDIGLISIGNGTASRETDKLVSELKARYTELKLSSIVVSEAGASVYSASELAAKEFPDLDVSYRGAVSIARRLQDPLAELVKIDPKSIGVGQYQHDVNQFKLSRMLESVMEDCVNAVGVDVNTASIPLLKCVAGLNESIAKNIVAFRDSNGTFKNRNVLKQIPRLGDKAFEQAAGFLRVVNGDNPLDASAVHPEAYSVVEKIMKQQQKNLHELMGNTLLLKSLNARNFIDDHFGLPTVIDILHELEKPGRDPRPEFKTATFKEGIETLKDLTCGMVLEGVVTNVANFGAFVDIGVHQDGLVHISRLADKFVKDPNQVVKVGDIVKVKVLEIDVLRKRIQLTMRLGEVPMPSGSEGKPSTPSPKRVKNNSGNIENSLSSILMKAMKK